MRVVDTRPARGSLRWLRESVNERTGELDAVIREALGLEAALALEWLSPLADDDYAEYRDGAFLSLLGLRLERRSLESFWPRRGPQWDGLARTADGKVLLVEAKANVPEIVSPATGARPASRALIERSLRETQSYLRVDADIPWSGRLYQYTNRIAHLYLLRVLNGVDAYLVNVYFTGAEDVGGPERVDQWEAALTVVKAVLGLGHRHRLARYMADVFVQVPRGRGG